jgi:hypothetical protein
LVAETGPKPVMPASAKQLTAWLKDTERWETVRDQLERWVATLVTHIRQGTFPLKPRSETCTDTCDFGQICRISQSRAITKNWELPLPGENASVVPEFLKPC